MPCEFWIILVLDTGYEKQRNCYLLSVVIVQFLSYARIFATPRTAAYLSLLSSPISQSILKFISIELVMPSNHLILCHPFPPAFSLSQHQGLFKWVGSSSSDGQSIRASALASVLPINIQDWFPLGLTDLKFKGLSRVFSNTTVQKHQFFGAQLYLWSNSHIHTWLLKKP